jgi:hypothetical protein
MDRARLGGEQSASTRVRWRAHRRHTSGRARASACLALVVGVAMFAMLWAVAGLRPTVSSPSEPRGALRPAIASALGRIEALPVQAQGTISTSLGRSDHAFRATATASGYRLRGGGVVAELGRRGVTLRSATGSARMTVASVGRGPRVGRSSALAVTSMSRTAIQNRVVYHGGPVTQWMAAGPLGLEQGFSVPRRPGGTGRTLEIALETTGASLPSLAGSGVAFISRTGATVLRYGGLSAVDATGHALPASIAVAANRVLLRVADRGARYPIRIDPFIQQGAKLTPNGESGFIEFGLDVSLSADGDTALVGAPGDSGGTGAAWVFTRSGTTWSEQAKLTANDETAQGAFGEAVALSADGRTALIGGYGDSTNGVNAGAAWVFVRNGSTWTQQGLKLLPNDEVNGGMVGGFPGSVSLSADGNTALIGGGQDGPGGAAGGAAWVFTRSGTAWFQQGAKLTGSDELGPGNFGASVSLSADGNTALVGGYTDNNFTGAAWVFTRSGSTWAPQGRKLTASDEIGQGVFGSEVRVSADGNTALIGGGEDNGGIGAAWVFTRSGTAWTQQGPKLTANDETGDGFFGSGVGLSADGNVALIGGFSANTVNGAAWIFTRSGIAWTQQGAKMLPADAAGVANFGDAVALSADAGTALIGGPGDNNSTGAAWVLTQHPVCANTTAETPAGGGTATIPFSCGAPADGGPLTYQIVSGPAHGALGNASGAAVGYSSTAGFFGTDQITYQALDSLGSSNVATATIAVPPARPVCQGTSALTPPGGGPAQVTLRCTAPSGVPLAYAVVSSPSHGTVSAVSQRAGTLVYVSRIGYSGLDRFTYNATDSSGASNTATATITVRKPLGTLAFALLGWQFDPHAGYTRVISMDASNLPVGARILIGCVNRICSLRTRSVTVSARTHCKSRTKRCRSKQRPHTRAVDLSPLVRNLHLKVGSRLQVSFQKRSYVGKVYLFTVRASKQPSWVATCLAPGSSVPGRGCRAG